jgi:hypothetical protein
MSKPNPEPLERLRNLYAYASDERVRIAAKAALSLTADEGVAD